MYLLLHYYLQTFYCYFALLLLSVVEGVKDLYPLIDISILLQNDNCSEGSEGPIFTPIFCYFAPPLLPVADGVKSLYPLLDIDIFLLHCYLQWRE